MGQPHTQPPRRLWLRALVAWLALSLATMALHRAAWRIPPGELTSTTDTLLKHASNLAQVMTLPGWLLDKVLQFDLPRVRAELIGAFGGWGFWFLAAWFIRRHWRSRPVPSAARPTAPGATSPGPVDLSRRDFLTRTAGASAVVGFGGVSAVGAVVNPLDLRVARYRVPIADLPPYLGGLRIVQLTDLHLGALVPESAITRAVSLAISLKPDLFALTGDYVDRGNTFTSRLPALLAPLAHAAPIGVIGVLGNHDYYGDHAATAAALEQAGVRMLDNANVYLDAASRRLVPSATGLSLCLAGVEDLAEARPSMDAALAGVPADTARLVLSHNPDVAEVCVKQRHRVDLLLCGHTHGGQVRLPLLGSMFVPSNYGEKYRVGLVQGPRCPVLISAGVGLTVLPIRIGVMPELVELTLVPK